MLSNILIGLVNTFTPINLIFITAGLIVGIIFGALPGFSAVMAVAVFVPVSYWLKPDTALLLLSALYCGAIYGGSIPAILLAIPGTPASAPTSFEGNAMTKKGQAGKALALCTTASAFGGFWSSIALLICAPLLAIVALKVGPPEQVMLAIFGLTVVCSLSFGNMTKGFLVGFISLLIATIGQDPVMGFPRFTFGVFSLTGGVQLTPVLIGIFSLPEVLKMLEEPLDKVLKASKVGKMHITLDEFRRTAFTAIKSTIIGIIIGIIPAAGPDVAAFLSYGEAKKVSKHPEEFGHGSIEGIVASEAANNGCTGGSLIPLLTLGIPGSAPAAVLLGAMFLHGLRPGPTLFTQQTTAVFTILVGFAVINILMLPIGWYFCKVSGKIIELPNSILATVIVILATVGAFSIQSSLFDVITMYTAGIIGYFMTKNDFPVTSVALALILGPMLEESISLTQTMFGSNILMMFTRPLTVLFALFALSSLLLPIIKNEMDKKKLKTKAKEAV